MSLDDYLKLLDWTGRVIRLEAGNGGHIAEDAPPILERLRCDVETWLDWVVNFGKRFRNEAALATSLQSFRETLRSRREISPLAT